MKHIVLYLPFLALSLTLGGCLAEELVEVIPDVPEDVPIVGEYVSANLTLDVGDVYVSSTRSEEPSDDPVSDTDAERHVDAIWVFQFDASSLAIVNGGAKLIEITDQTELQNLPTENVLVTNNGNPSIVYVVANVGIASWVSVSTGFTLNDLLETTIPNPDPIYVNTDGNPASSIPMSGRTEGSVTVSNHARIIVPVYRMFAKLMVNVKVSVEDESIEAEPLTLDIGSIPNVCQVGTLYSGDDSQSAEYPFGTKFLPWTFDMSNRDSNYVYVIYVPENIQGEVENPNDLDKSSIAPNYATMVTTHLNLTTQLSDGTRASIKSDPQYTVYPGGNITNNFNIRRNCVYRVNVRIAPDDVISPSANCLVASVGELFAFYPYERDETGHRNDAADKGVDGEGLEYYDFEAHLTPKEESLTIKGVKIIWQTQHAIGDNSKYDKVWIVDGDIQKCKIYVQTNATGNALIGAYNNAECTGDVLWSWHIWITNTAPDNVNNAIEYSHYTWDETGIHTDERQLGYPVMNCNLGALATETGTTFSAYTQTYGMLYQWGRKDPFPPVKTTSKISGRYNYDNATGNVYVYDNSDSLIDLTGNNGSVNATSGYSVFNTVMTDNSSLITQTQEGGLLYSIHNPTTFIASCDELTAFDESQYDNLSYYHNQGDWLPGGDNDLWGGNGTGESTDGNVKSLQVYDLTNWESKDSNERFVASLEDNYGDYKTIFDPCPYGWRVSPGDLWLGFTLSGKNWYAYSSETNINTLMAANVNCVETTTTQVANNMGFHMYMNGWKAGDVSFFPTQGSRLASGQPAHGGICGNYHNATVDETVDVLDYNNVVQPDAIRRVDIIHFHNAGASAYTQVNNFEKELIYYNRAVAGPVRCVRDTKR